MEEVNPQDPAPISWEQYNELQRADGSALRIFPPGVLRTQLTEDELRALGVVEENNLPFVCPYCEQEFEDDKQKEIEMHLKEHAAGNYACGKCEQRFETIEEKIEHYDAHRAEYELDTLPYSSYRVVCDICIKPFPSYQSLREHWLKVHGKISRREKLKRFKCEKCHEIFLTSYNLNSHRVKTHVTDKCRCAICNAPFSDEKFRDKHQKPHSYQFECDLCGRKTQTKEDMVRHMNIHTDRFADFVVPSSDSE